MIAILVRLFITWASSVWVKETLHCS